MGKRKKRKRKPKRLAKHYSGDSSTEFWDRIHSLHDEAHEGAYMLGCALQDLEDRVITYVNNALLDARKPA